MWSCSQGPKFQEIVNLRLADGEIRRGQVLEIDGERAVVQVIFPDTILHSSRQDLDSLCVSAKIIPPVLIVSRSLCAGVRRNCGD